MKKLCREYKIENDLLNVKFGTINREQPKVFYITFNGWIKNCTEIEEIIRNYKEYITSLIHNHQQISNNFLFNYEIATNKQNKKNKNYFTLEITLKQNQENYISNIKTLFYKMEDFIIAIMDYLLTTFNNNDIEITKKK